MAAGGLMVSSNSNIDNINDLKGKKIGIAGGSIDKSWLILEHIIKICLEKILGMKVNKFLVLLLYLIKKLNKEVSMQY